jgi:hypothetical protein
VICSKLVLATGGIGGLFEKFVVEFLGFTNSDLFFGVDNAN